MPAEHSCAGHRRQGGPSRRRGDRGTVLLLVPAGFLILIVLAAITFDFALLHLRQRELVDLAEAAANDAAAAAIDQGALRERAEVVLDDALVRSVVGRSLTAHTGNLTLVGAPIVRLRSGATVVEVTVQARVDYVFARAVPGGPQSATLEATAVAGVLGRGPFDPP